jgi:hypothetical protein
LAVRLRGIVREEFKRQRGECMFRITLLPYCNGFDNCDVNATTPYTTTTVTMAYTPTPLALISPIGLYQS